MEHVGGVDILQAPQDLVQEVADMVVAQLLALEQFVHVCLHQVLHDLDEVGDKGTPVVGSGRQLVKKNRLC